MDERVSARGWAGVGKASDYISTFECLPGDRFIFVARESIVQNAHKLAHAIARLRRAVVACGGYGVDWVTHVGPGSDPSWLAEAANLAKAEGATLLAESTDRLIRSAHYHPSKWTQAQASTPELENLRFWTGGVRLMTLVDPDATPGKVRSEHTRRGQAATGNKGGRPTAKRRGPYQPNYQQSHVLAEVRRMRMGGLSVREIARQLERRPSTVQGWCQKIERS